MPGKLPENGTGPGQTNKDDTHSKRKIMHIDIHGKCVWVYVLYALEIGRYSVDKSGI